MALKSKSAKKITVKKSGKTQKRSKPSSLLKSLPESIEHIEIVQQVASVLEELQKRVLDVKAEASKELKKLMKRYETNYKGIEKKVNQVTSEAKKQAQTSMIHLVQKWHEHKEKLPKPMAKEIEKIIGQIGTKVVAASTKKSTSKKPSATAKKKTAAAKKKASAVRTRKSKAAGAEPMSSTEENE